ncbi:MAG: hypothetical protein J0H89_14605 [Rhizobiales bacterium]|nr:hypothetical protein [Hyphomicrobiales bacterium]
MLLAAVAAFPTALAAQVPTQQELAHVSPSGSYLAARHAGVEIAFYAGEAEHQFIDRARLEMIAGCAVDAGDTRRELSRRDDLVPSPGRQQIEHRGRPGHIILSSAPPME